MNQQKKVENAETIKNLFEKEGKNVFMDQIESGENLHTALHRAVIILLKDGDEVSRQRVAQILRVKNPLEPFPIDKDSTFRKLSTIFQTEKNKIEELLLAICFDETELVDIKSKSDQNIKDNFHYAHRKRFNKKSKA